MRNRFYYYQVSQLVQSDFGEKSSPLSLYETSMTLVRPLRHDMIFKEFNYNRYV